MNILDWNKDKRSKNSSKLHQELITLEFGSRNAVKRYYLKKIKILSAVIVSGMVLTLLCWFGEREMDGKDVTDYLKRPDYGAGDQMESLNVQVEGEKEQYEMEITVHERTYTDQEKKTFLAQAVQELDKTIQGENDSLNEVRLNMNLPASMINDTVKVSWITVPYGVIDEQGKIIGAENKDGTLVELQGTLMCGTLEQIYTVYAKVFPPVLNAKEQFIAEVREAVEVEDAKKSHEEYFVLPNTVGEKTLIWSQDKNHAAGTIFLLTLLAAGCVYIQLDNEIHKKAEKRSRQLMMDYPDLMWKMTMLLGAGQSIRGAFAKIAEEYRKKEKKVRWVYEEVAITCLEMQSGIPEAQAYERFGRRCQLPEYLRLGTVLSQNLKKGSKGLTGMMKKEAEMAVNERKNYARKIGEQAETKLLLPMILMLSVVLTVLMVPAFMAF